MENFFLTSFQDFRSILCLCPHCNSFSRVSDLHLRTKGKAPKTWLDDYELSLQELEEQESKFAEEEGKIRELAIKRGRSKVPKLVKKSMDEQFAATKYDPYDIKAVLHPVEFIVFNGMNKGELDDVVLLSRTSSNKNISRLQKSIANVVKEKRYDWKVARVSLDGDIEFE